MNREGNSCVVVTPWISGVKTVRYLGIYQLVQRFSELCRIGLVSDGALRPPVYRSQDCAV